MRTAGRIVPDNRRADDGLPRRHGSPRADPDGADELGGRIELGLRIFPDRFAGFLGAHDGGIGPPPDLNKVLHEVGDFARVAAVVDGPFGGAGGAIVAWDEPAQPPPAAHGVGRRLPQAGDFAIGGERDAGQADGCIIDALEADEAVGLIQHDVFAVAAIAGIMQADDKHLRLDPVSSRLHEAELELKQRQRARIAEKIKLGMADDFRRLALRHDLHAISGPITVVQLRRIQAPNGAHGGFKGGRVAAARASILFCFRFEVLAGRTPVASGAAMFGLDPAARLEIGGASRNSGRLQRCRYRYRQRQG